MKVLIVSDSHSRLDNLIEIWEKEVPDIVISAGDYNKDVEELSYIYNSSKYYMVRGNCDFRDFNIEDLLEFELLNKKIFLTHGHLFGVKISYDYLRMEAKDRGSDICIFGHTHIPYIEEKETILFNPGAVKDGLYGILNIENNKINIEHKKL